MDKKSRAILYGLALGDGHISYRTRYKNGKYRYEQAELIIGHGPNQKDYLEHKADVLTSIFGGNRPKVSETKHTLSNDKTYTGFRIAKTNPYFRLMHKLLYKENRKKKITKEVLAFCDEVSLAYWFMDDGSIIHNTNKQGEITSLNFSLATYFSEEEAKDVVEWLSSKFDIETTYYLSKGSFVIRGATQSTIKLVDLIFDHIHPNLFYKIKSLAKFTIRKSARHPHFKVDDDIVRSVKKKIDSVGEINSLQ